MQVAIMTLRGTNTCSILNTFILSL